MKVLQKRKQTQKENFDHYVIPYKKRLVCNFSNMSLEENQENPGFFEKKIMVKKIEPPTINDPFCFCDSNNTIVEENKQNENKGDEENYIKPYNLSWDVSIRDHIDCLIKPDFLLDKIINNYYEKE